MLAHPLRAAGQHVQPRELPAARLPVRARALPAVPVAPLPAAGGAPRRCVYLAGNVSRPTRYGPQAVAITAFIFLATPMGLARLGRRSVEKVTVDRRVLITLLLACLSFYILIAPSSPYQQAVELGGRDAVDGARLARPPLDRSRRPRAGQPVDAHRPGPAPASCTRSTRAMPPTRRPARRRRHPRRRRRHHRPPRAGLDDGGARGEPSRWRSPTAGLRTRPPTIWASWSTCARALVTSLLVDRLVDRLVVAAGAQPGAQRVGDLVERGRIGIGPRRWRSRGRACRGSGSRARGSGGSRSRRSTSPTRAGSKTSRWAPADGVGHGHEVLGQVGGEIGPAGRPRRSAPPGCGPGCSGLIDRKATHSASRHTKRPGSSPSMMRLKMVVIAGS